MLNSGPGYSFLASRFSESFESVLVGQDALPPGLVVEIPGNYLAEVGFVVLFGLPADFVADLGGVDGISEVLAGAIGNGGIQKLEASG